MKRNIYAVRDAILGFSAMVLDVNDASAMRSFADACNRTDSPYKTNPADYTLMRLGVYDTDSGIIDSVLPEHICCATDFIRKDIIDD